MEPQPTLLWPGSDWQITRKSLGPGVRRGDDTVILNFRFEHQE